MATIPEFDFTGAQLRQAMVDLDAETAAKAEAVTVAALMQRLAALELVVGPDPTTVMVEAPTASATTLLAGQSITLTTGLWSNGTPVGVLTHDGEDVTAGMMGEDWTAPWTAGSWSWTVTAGNAAPYVISGTVALPEALTVLAADPLAITATEGQVVSRSLSTMFSSPYALGYTLSGAPAGVTINSGSVRFPSSLAVDSYSFTVTATDPYSQTASISINLTVAEASAEPTVSINAKPGGKLTVTMEEGTADLSLVQPYVGDYEIGTANTAAGPVALVPPSVTGTPGPEQVYTADNGAYYNDASAGEITWVVRWQRDEEDIPGSEALTYLTTQDDAVGIRRAVTVSDTNGSRTYYSDVLDFAEGALPTDTFTVASYIGLKNYVGESGEGWTKINLSQTQNLGIKETTGRVEGGRHDGCYRGAATRGPDQYAKGLLVRGSDNTQTALGRGFAVCMNDTLACYIAGMILSTNTFVIQLRDEAGAYTTLASVANSHPDFTTAGQEIEVTFDRADGGLLTADFGGVVLTTTDTTLTDGGVGILGTDTRTGGTGMEISSFDGGSR